MKRKLLITIFILLTIVLIVILFVYFSNKAKGADKAELVNKDGFPLKYGSTGQEVINLQKYLVSVDPQALKNYGVDGKWGNETQAAVEKILQVKEVSYKLYQQIINK